MKYLDSHRSFTNSTPSLLQPEHQLAPSANDHLQSLIKSLSATLSTLSVAKKEEQEIQRLKHLQQEAMTALVQLAIERSGTAFSARDVWRLVQ
ncbi:hypothetical protein T439DRAFT_353996 [Meredithblackwellia eburnea MCA 4105]